MCFLSFHTTPCHIILVTWSRKHLKIIIVLIEKFPRLLRFHFLRFPMHHRDVMIFHERHCHRCRPIYSIHHSLKIKFFSFILLHGSIHWHSPLFCVLPTFEKALGGKNIPHRKVFPFFAIAVTVGAFWKTTIGSGVQCLDFIIHLSFFPCVDSKTAFNARVVRTVMYFTSLLHSSIRVESFNCRASKLGSKIYIFVLPATDSESSFYTKMQIPAPGLIKSFFQCFFCFIERFPIASSRKVHEEPETFFSRERIRELFTYFCHPRRVGDYLWQWKVSFHSPFMYFQFISCFHLICTHIFLIFFIVWAFFCPRVLFLLRLCLFLFVCSELGGVVLLCLGKTSETKVFHYWIFLISRFFPSLPPLDETWVDPARHQACRRHAKEASSHSRGHRGERRLWINANRSNFKRKPFRDANTADGNLLRELNRMHGIWGPFNSSLGHHHRRSAIRLEPN